MRVIKLRRKSTQLKHPEPSALTSQQFIRNKSPFSNQFLISNLQQSTYNKRANRHWFLSSSLWLHNHKKSLGNSHLLKKNSFRFSKSLFENRPLAFWIHKRQYVTNDFNLEVPTSDKITNEEQHSLDKSTTKFSPAPKQNQKYGAVENVSFQLVETPDRDYKGKLYKPGIKHDSLLLLKKKLDECDKALVAEPNDVVMLYKRASILISLNRIQEALTCYNKVLAVYPGHLVTLDIYGDLLVDCNRLEEALASYDKALILCPTYSNILYKRFLLLKKLNRLEEALNCSDQYLTSISGSIVLLADKGVVTEVFCMRGDMLKVLGRLEEALANYYKAEAYDCNYYDWLDDSEIAMNISETEALLKQQSPSKKLKL